MCVCVCVCLCFVSACMCVDFSVSPLLFLCRWLQQRESSWGDDSDGARRPKSFMETLAKVKPPLKASEALQCVPMGRLTKREWKFYQIFSICWLLLHLAFMLWCSYRAQDEVREFLFKPGKTTTPAPTTTTTTTSAPLLGNATVGNKSASSSSSLSAASLSGSEYQVLDVLILIYALIMVLFMTLVPLYRIGRYLKRKLTKNFDRKYVYNLVRNRGTGKRVRKPRLKDEAGYKIYNEYVEDKGAVLSFLTYFAAFIVEEMSAILPVCFAVAAIWAFSIGKTEETIRQFAFAKGLFLLLGWLLILVPLRAYSPIYNFLTALKFIVVKDMLPYTIFFCIITVAFSCALQLQFQFVSRDAVDAAEDASGFSGFFTMFGTVMYELVIMSTGQLLHTTHLLSLSSLLLVNQSFSLFLFLSLTHTHTHITCTRGSHTRTSYQHLTHSHTCTHTRNHTHAHTSLTCICLQVWTRT